MPTSNKRSACRAAVSPTRRASCHCSSEASATDHWTSAVSTSFSAVNMVFSYSATASWARASCTAVGADASAVQQRQGHEHTVTDHHLWRCGRPGESKAFARTGPVDLQSWKHLTPRHAHAGQCGVQRARLALHIRAALQQLARQDGGGRLRRLRAAQWQCQVGVVGLHPAGAPPGVLVRANPLQASRSSRAPATALLASARYQAQKRSRPRTSGARRPVGAAPGRWFLGPGPPGTRGCAARSRPSPHRPPGRFAPR